MCALGGCMAQWRSSGFQVAAISILTAVIAAAQPPVITFRPTLGTYPIGEVQYPLTASGGNGTFSWTLQSGTLPPGVSVRTDIPSFFPAGASAGLIGVATTPGT